MQNKDGASGLLKGFNEIICKGISLVADGKQGIFSAATALYKLDLFRSLVRFLLCKLDLMRIE